MGRNTLTPDEVTTKVLEPKLLEDPATAERRSFNVPSPQPFDDVPNIPFASMDTIPSSLDSSRRRSDSQSCNKELGNTSEDVFEIGTEALKEDSNSESDSLGSNKAASFYIGDDQQMLPQPMSPPLEHTQPPEEPTSPPVSMPLQPSTRRVHISEAPIKKAPVFVPPDGGYGWIVALAACLSNLWIVGFIKSYGVLYLHIRGTFPEASAYQASWLPALLTTLGLLIG